MQVRPEGAAGGLRGVPDALPAHRAGGEGPAAVRARAPPPGPAGRGGPLHAALQQDRAAHAEDEHHHLRGQLLRQRGHADAAAQRHHRRLGLGQVVAQAEEDAGGRRRGRSAAPGRLVGFPERRRFNALLCFSADHPGVGELHEQQQERLRVRLQAAESRPGGFFYSARASTFLCLST